MFSAIACSVKLKRFGDKTRKGAIIYYLSNETAWPSSKWFGTIFFLLYYCYIALTRKEFVWLNRNRNKFLDVRIYFLLQGKNPLLTFTVFALDSFMMWFTINTHFLLVQVAIKQYNSAACNKVWPLWKAKIKCFIITVRWQNFHIYSKIQQTQFHYPVIRLSKAWFEGDYRSFTYLWNAFPFKKFTAAIT